MRPKVSIIIPISDMENGAFFLWRNINSIMSQTFKDYEIVITKEGRACENKNAAMRKARGELIKFLDLDDYFAHPDALKLIVNNFRPEDRWLVSGCLHDKGDGVPVSPHYPQYVDDIHTGNNLIGGSSVLTIRREACLYWDTDLDWLFDGDMYKRNYDAYGEPRILNDLNVVIGLHPGQLTNTIPGERKLDEIKLMMKRYA